jgi:hypothetical protein
MQCLRGQVTKHLVINHWIHFLAHRARLEGEGLALFGLMAATDHQLYTDTVIRM